MVHRVAIQSIHAVQDSSQLMKEWLEHKFLQKHLWEFLSNKEQCHMQYTIYRRSRMHPPWTTMPAPHFSVLNR